MSEPSLAGTGAVRPTNERPVSTTVNSPMCSPSGSSATDCKSRWYSAGDVMSSASDAIRVPDAALADEPDVLPERVHRGVREEHLAVDVRHQDPVGRRVEDSLALGQQPLALRLRRVPFGDVDDRAEVAGDRAVLGVERDGAARDPRDRLVPPQEAELDRELDAAERERRPRVRDVAGVLGVDRLAPPVPERLVARQAAQLLPLVVDEDAPAVRVGRVDADGGAARRVSR